MLMVYRKKNLIEDIVSNTTNKKNTVETNSATIELLNIIKHIGHFGFWECKFDCLVQLTKCPVISSKCELSVEIARKHKCRQGPMEDKLPWTITCCLIGRVGKIYFSSIMDFFLYITWNIMCDTKKIKFRWVHWSLPKVGEVMELC